ncbi:MAG: TRAP transporter substrate-binding protein DctP [Burkholderiaceae bacterium]
MKARFTQVARTTGLAAGLVLASAGVADGAEYTMKIGHVSAVTQPISTCIEVMKSHIETFSSGRIAVEHYPAGQLGNYRENVEQVQLGSLELTYSTGGGISNIFPPIQAFDIPYLFNGERVIDKVMDDPELNAKLRADVLKATNTVRLLGMSGDHGWRSFFTTTEVQSAADLKGLKIRTIESPISMELVRSLGARPTPVSWPEVYTSLATGIVTGTKNSLSDIIDMNFTDFIKYGVLDNHTYITFFWWVNDPWLKSLPEDLRAVVLNGFEAGKTTCAGLIDATMLPKLKKWAEVGGKLHIPTPKEREGFVVGQKAVADWYVKNYGSEYFDLLKAAAARAETAIAAENATVLK